MVLQRFTAFLRGLVSGRGMVEDEEGLVRFMAGEASFIAQKCAVEYCRARAGLNWDKLFKEAAFQEAMEHCRWEAFAAVLGDVALVADGRLRRPGGRGSPELAAALAGLAERALTSFGVPAHRADKGWADVAEVIGARLARAQLAPPLPAHEIARASGKAVWGLLPVHRDIRAYDRELIANNIRFNMCRCAEEMDRRFAPRLAGAVLGTVPAAA